MVVLLSGIFGVLIGGIAGYVGGRIDTFVTVVVVNSLMAFPGFSSLSHWWRFWGRESIA
jgi:ABC-type dipeptide/oligopeptide/nickel transport system permease subunit